MKKIVILLLLMNSYILSAQTNLEKLVINELNIYRKEHNLPAVYFDVSIYNAAKYHSTWMSKSKVCSHYENKDVPGFTEIYGPEERGEHFGLLNNIASFSEICNFARSTDNSNPIMEKPLSDQQLAKQIIEKFSRSPEHDSAMRQEIDPKLKLKVGVSVIVNEGIAYTTIYFIEK